MVEAQVHRVREREGEKEERMMRTEGGFDVGLCVGLFTANINLGFLCLNCGQGG